MASSWPHTSSFLLLTTINETSPKFSTKTMLSLTKQFTTTLTKFPSKSTHTHCRSLTLAPIKARFDDDGGNGFDDDDESGAAPPPFPQPSTVGIRFRRGTKKRRQLELDGGAKQPPPPPPPKEWESMTLGEKAMELYVGEKGLLFWLNKFAYASIFAMIGGWILFRFVGPALNLYQLDAPPLAPEAMFKDS